MLRLKAGDELYIYSSEEVTCIISGVTIIQGIRTPKTLFNYIVRANTTRLVYQSLEGTEINEISIINSTAVSTIKVFINGTTVEDQVYETIVGPDHTYIHNTSGWVDNEFVEPDASITTTETNSLAIKNSLDTLDNAVAGNELQVDVLTMPPVTGMLTDAELRATPVPVTANAGTNLNTSALSLESTLQGVKTAVETLDNIMVTEDAPLASDPSGVLLLVRRMDSLISEVSANRDAIALNASSQGELYTHLSDIAIGLKRTLQALERPPYMTPMGAARIDWSGSPGNGTSLSVINQNANQFLITQTQSGTGLIDQTFTYYTQNRDVFNNWKSNRIT